MLKLINNSQVKIIEEVFKNPGINLRTLIQRTSLSPNFVSKYVNLLIKKEIVTEEKFEKQKVYLRRFFLNFKSTTTKNLFSLIKEEQKENFFGKYPKFRPIFNQITENIKKIDFFLIYGSYARLSADEDSDLDILIVGKIKDLEKIREILVSLDIEVSIKIETYSDFKKRIKEPLHQQIIKDNILVFDDDNKFCNLLTIST